MDEMQQVSCVGVIVKKKIKYQQHNNNKQGRVLCWCDGFLFLFCINWHNQSFGLNQLHDVTDYLKTRTLPSMMKLSRAAWWRRKDDERRLQMP